MNFEAIGTSCLNANDTPWMPFAPYSDRIRIRYLKIDPVHGETVTLLSAPAGAELPRHHHTGTVIVYTLSGRWKYKEHGWIAGPGSVVYETAASVHTPEALAGSEDVVTFNIVRGELVYLDAEDKVVAVENWKSSMKRYLDYCRANNVPQVDLSSFAA